MTTDIDLSDAVTALVVARHLGPARRRHADPGRVVLALSPPVLGLSVPVLMVSLSGR
jgi:hypothetical protein